MTAERTVYDEILFEKIYIRFTYGLYVAGRLSNTGVCDGKCELYAALHSQ